MTTCEDKKRMLRILFGTMKPCAERVVDQFATAFRQNVARCPKYIKCRNDTKDTKNSAACGQGLCKKTIISGFSFLLES